MYKLCQRFVIYLQYFPYPLFWFLIQTDWTLAIIYRQVMKLLIATVFAGRVPLVIIKIKFVEHLGLFASTTFLVYRRLFFNVVGSNICRLKLFHFLLQSSLGTLYVVKNCRMGGGGLPFACNF